jgi:glutaredoxin
MLKLYCLKNCYYCDNSLRLCKVYNIPHNVIFIQENNKDKYKKKLKTNTFPQIYLTNNSKNYIIGGNEQFEYLISILDMLKKFNFNIKIIELLKPYI